MISQFQLTQQIVLKWPIQSPPSIVECFTETSLALAAADSSGDRQPSAAAAPGGSATAAAVPPALHGGEDEHDGDTTAAAAQGGHVQEQRVRGQPSSGNRADRLLSGELITNTRNLLNEM